MLTIFLLATCLRESPHCSRSNICSRLSLSFLPSSPPSHLVFRAFSLAPHLHVLYVQGTSKERFPGCVNLGKKVEFCLPTAGRRTQFFHPILKQPGKHSLEVPCTMYRYRLIHGPRFQEYEDNKLRSPACSRQKNANFFILIFSEPGPRGFADPCTIT